MAGAWHALVLRSNVKGQGRTVIKCAVSVGLQVDMTV